MANLTSLRGLLISAAFVLLSGCGSHLPFVIHAGNPNQVKTSPGLTGQFQTTDQQNQDLSKSGDLPVVLIFSQDTCAACGVEAEALRGALKNPTTAPSLVHVFTILVGAVMADAIDWKDLHRVPWAVGTDLKSELFKQYCAEQTVPCIVVYVPEKGIVLRKNGSANLVELSGLTGPWED